MLNYVISDSCRPGGLSHLPRKLLRSPGLRHRGRQSRPAAPVPQQPGSRDPPSTALHGVRWSPRNELSMSFHVMHSVDVNLAIIRIPCY
eukprot:scaffold8647_cov40-Prasinocladus_malaysianus.AAC.4